MPPSTYSGDSRKSSVTQPRRPRSPVSMYVSDFGFAPPLQPKPLAKSKLENRSKGKAKQTSTSDITSISSYSSPSPSFGFQSAFASSSNTSFTSNGSRASLKSKQSSFSLSPTSILKTLRRKSSAKPTPSLTSSIAPDARPPSPLPQTNDTKVGQPIKPARALGEQSPSQSLRSGSLDSDVRDSVDSYAEPIRFATRPNVLSPVHNRDYSAYNHSAYNQHERKPSVPTSPPTWLAVNSQIPLRPPRQRRPKTAPSSSEPHTPDFPHTPTGSFQSDTIPSTPSPSLSPSTSATGSFQTESSDEVEPKTPTLPRSKSIGHTHHNHSYSDTRPDTPFMDVTMPMHTFLSATWSSRNEPNAIRKERSQGWSGEWNRDNMQDVIEKLRTLK